MVGRIVPTISAFISIVTFLPNFFDRHTGTCLDWENNSCRIQMLFQAAVHYYPNTISLLKACASSRVSPALMEQPLGWIVQVSREVLQPHCQRCFPCSLSSKGRLSLELTLFGYPPPCVSPRNSSIGRMGASSCIATLRAHPLQALPSRSATAQCRCMFFARFPIIETSFSIKTQRTRGLRSGKGRFTVQLLSVALL